MASEIIREGHPDYDPTVNLQIKPQNRKWAALGIMIAIALNASGVATLGTILPTITEEIGGYDMYSYASVFNGMIAMVVAGIGGKLVERYGAKTVLGAATIFLSLSRILMFLSNSMPVFIALYLISGIGGGLAMASGMATITNIFPAGKREVWVGVYGITNGAIYFAFPHIGAYFATNMGWRFTYYCMLPVAVVGLLLIWRYLPNVKKENPGKLDIGGVVLLFLCGALLILLTSYGGKLIPWLSIQSALIVVAFVVFTILLMKVEAKAGDDALLPVICFKQKGFIWIFIGAIFAQAQATPYTLYVGLYFQRVLGTSVALSAWPASITAIVSAIVNYAIGIAVGRAAGKTARKVIFFMCVFHMSTALFYFFAQSTWPVPLFLGVAVWRGIGSALHMTGFTWVCQKCLPRNMMGFAVSIMFMCNNIGGAISPAISNVILTAGTADPVVQLPWIFFYTFICACIVAVSGLFIKENLSFEEREGYSK